MRKRTILNTLGIMAFISFCIYFCVQIIRIPAPDLNVEYYGISKPSLVMEDQYYSSQRNDLLKRIDSLAFSQKDKITFPELNEQFMKIVNRQDSLRKENDYQVQVAEYSNLVKIFLEQRKEDLHFWTNVFRISSITLLILLILAIKFIKPDEK